MENKKDLSVHITLENVVYTVVDRRPKRVRSKGPLALLTDVTAVFQPGQLSGLMGPSGCGKTTLLDLVAGRKSPGAAGTHVDGIRFAGIVPSQQYLRRYTGYVEQHDTLLPMLTVQEMLLYTAELKRPMSEPFESKAFEVEALLCRLGLDTCRSVLCGSAAKRGISGGQAKRTNIGIALITEPRVLFLDEPTTGLDSYTANEVMTVVKRLTVTDGVTVVATVHSPTAYTFSLFDTLLMLLGGRVVFAGPQGPSIIEFLTSAIADVKMYTPGYNDSEYIVDLITEADRFGRGPALADAFAASPLAAAVVTDVAQVASALARQPLAEDVVAQLHVSVSTVTPWWWSIRMLLKYRTSKLYRDPAFLAPRIFDKIFFGSILVTLYLGVGDDLSQDNITNIAAILFMWSATTGFSAAAYVPSLVLERGLFVRERNDGLYFVITYLVTKMLDELAVNALSTAVVCAFTFYGMQLQGDWILFWITYYTSVAVGISAAYFVASWAPNLDVANALLPILMWLTFRDRMLPHTDATTLMFFAGFLIRLDNIPSYWQWYSYIDHGRYSWGALMVNQFQGDRNVLYIGGQSVLDYFGLGGIHSKWRFVGFTALFYVFFFTATYLVLSIKRYQIR